MSRGRKPAVDPELERMRKEARLKAEEDKKKKEKALLDEEAARKRGLRGARSLLTGGFVGFKFTGDSNDRNSNLGS